MSSLVSIARRVWAAGYPPADVPKSADAIRIGVLGAADIAPTALIGPARSHPDVVVAAVAARDAKKAQDFASKHGIPKVLGSYQDIIDDATIDAVYIPLPNSYHYEWSVKALRAGKHVLLEKPSTSNTVEARSLFNLPSTLPSPAPVLLEAFHYKFHPAWHRFLSLLDPPSIACADVSFSIPAGYLRRNDIRYQYRLSGGALMDLGCYAISMLTGALGAYPEECISATARPVKKPGEEGCDEAFQASFRFPNGAIGTADLDMSKVMMCGIPKIERPKMVVKHKEALVADDEAPSKGQSHVRTRTVTYWNFIRPDVWHRIDVVDEHVIWGGDGQAVRAWTTRDSKTAYSWADVAAAAADDGDDDLLQQEHTVRVDDESWSTYRHMLEQFVNTIKARRGSGVWVDADESIQIMRLIDCAYTKAGLLPRPSSQQIDEE